MKRDITGAPLPRVCVVAYGEDRAVFMHTTEERISHLLDGAVDRYPVRRYLPHAIVIDGETMPIDGDVYVCDPALQERLAGRDFRLIEVHAEESTATPEG